MLLNKLGTELEERVSVRVGHTTTAPLGVAIGYHNMSEAKQEMVGGKHTVSAGLVGMNFPTARFCVGVATNEVNMNKVWFNSQYQVKEPLIIELTNEKLGDDGWKE
jgi:hypothetical protein